jgi:GPI ethanolamine phosphate transferase 2/3 subunit F
MPSRKTRSRKAATPNAQTQLPKHVPDVFPFASYVSVVGVHMTLLVFVAFFLARVPHALLRSSPPSGGLTRNPALTLAWICAGSVPLQGWWAGWVRKWWIQIYTKGTDGEKRLGRNERDKGKISVSHTYISIRRLSLPS